jgi:hypothetical protein
MVSGNPNQKPMVDATTRMVPITIMASGGSAGRVVRMKKPPEGVNRPHLHHTYPGPAIPAFRQEKSRVFTLAGPAEVIRSLELPIMATALIEVAN